MCKLITNQTKLLNENLLKIFSVFNVTCDILFSFKIFIFYRYESFDFHHECRNMRWDRLSILMDKVAEERKQLG